MGNVKGGTAGLATVVAFGAVLFLACSSDTTGPAVKALGEGRTDGEIYGYCYDALTSNPLGAHVVWTCERDNATLGDVYADSSGRYDIYGQSWWTNHSGHHFRGNRDDDGLLPGVCRYRLLRSGL